jgi:hypothetical protein
MGKRFNQLLTLCLCTFSAFSFLFLLSPVSPNVSAHTRSQEPMVMVAKDMTASSNCKSTATLNIGTSHVKVVHLACAPGTNIAAFEVPLSVAYTHRWDYIVLPSGKISVSSQAKLSSQIQELIQSTQKAALKASKMRFTLPDTACGSNATQYYQFNYDGDTVLTVVKWYKFTNCSQLNIYTAEEALVSGSTNASWGHFDYASASVNVSCYYLNGAHGHYVSYPVDLYSYPVGYQPVFVNFYNNIYCSSGSVHQATPALN